MRCGFSATSLQLVGPRGVPDEIVLERATELGCILITHNARDFKALHAAILGRGRGHGGIICIPQTIPFSRLELRAAMMLAWVSSQEHTSRLFQWGQLQRLLEQGFRLPGFNEDDIRQALGRA